MQQVVCAVARPSHKDAASGGLGDDTYVLGVGDGAASNEETGFAVEFVTDDEAADTLVFDCFGYSSIDDLSFQNVQSGDLAIALSATRFVVLEGITDEAELTGDFVFG